MNEIYFYAILSVVIVSLISLIGLLTVWFTNPHRKTVFIFLVCFSAGALLGDAFIHLVPELAEEGNLNINISSTILYTLVAFFIIERYLHWHHHHGEGDADEHSTHPFVYTNLIGDSIHNFIDGLIIGGAYLIDINLGIATTVAVILHEIPQEIGDFGVLIYGGFTRVKALMFNLLSALTALVGTLVALYFGQSQSFLPYLAAVAVGSFIYIALADLIPQIHKSKDKPFIQLASLIAGVVIMYLLLFLE